MMLKIESLKIEHIVSLNIMLSCLDDGYFRPHSFDLQSLENIVLNTVKDLYYVMLLDEDVVGYGLLRGWDEGYDIPSLGIAISQGCRGCGYGKQLMIFLHEEAKKKGSAKIMLKVDTNNVVAQRVYTKLGYKFLAKDNYYLGVKEL